MELFYRSNKPKEVKALISEMTKNVDSRGDADERILERMEFVNVLLHMKNTADCDSIVKEVRLPSSLSRSSPRSARTEKT